VADDNVPCLEDVLQTLGRMSMNRRAQALYVVALALAVGGNEYRIFTGCGGAAGQGRPGQR